MTNKPQWPVPDTTNIDLPTFRQNDCIKCGSTDYSLFFCPGWHEPKHVNTSVFGLPVEYTKERCGIAGEHLHRKCGDCGFMDAMRCKDHKGKE